MAKKKKNKTRERIVSVLLFALAGGLILYGAFSILVPYIKYEKETKANNEEVSAFLNSLPEQSAKAESSNLPVSLPGGTGYTVEDIAGQVVGILTAPSVDIQAPIAMGTDTDTLNRFAGVFEEYDLPGTPGGNTAIASHSSRYDYFCSYCYFQNIGNLKPGDEVDLLWRDGNTYRYQVYDVKLNQSPEDMTPFERVDGKEILTLQTCTDGVHGTRTFVHCERMK